MSGGPVVVVGGGRDSMPAVLLLLVVLLAAAVYYFVSNPGKVLAAAGRPVVDAVGAMVGAETAGLSDGEAVEEVAAAVKMRAKDAGTRALLAGALTLAFVSGWWVPGLVGLGVVGAYAAGKKWAESRGGERSGAIELWLDPSTGQGGGRDASGSWGTDASGAGGYW